MAEQAFATELQKLTAHLAKRLTGLQHGQPKVFRDSVRLRRMVGNDWMQGSGRPSGISSSIGPGGTSGGMLALAREVRMSEPNERELVVDAGGGVRGIDEEALDLRALGRLQITRASHVEPDLEGNWFADMGPVLGPFGTRGEALAAERGWLRRSAS